MWNCGSYLYYCFFYSYVPLLMEKDIQSLLLFFFYSKGSSHPEENHSAAEECDNCRNNWSFVSCLWKYCQRYRAVLDDSLVCERRLWS